MTWEEARAQYPHQWLVFEIFDSRIENGKMLIPRLEVVGAYEDWQNLWERYKEVKNADRCRDYGFYHSSHEKLNLKVKYRF